MKNTKVLTRTSSNHDQQSFSSKIYFFLQQSQNDPYDSYSYYAWMVFLQYNIICNIYFWHTGNGRLWEPNQSLDGSDSLSSQKDEGTTRKILFPFWHSRMHQRLFLVIFCPFLRNGILFQKLFLPTMRKIGLCDRDFFFFEIHGWEPIICNRY